jgi:putative nucleotidyltransferase with HDIG domain
VAVLAAAIVVAVFTTRANEWTPFPLLLILTGLAAGSALLTVEVRGAHISGAFSSIVLAMLLLGPAPAMVVAFGVVAFSAAHRFPGWSLVAVNTATYAAFPLVGGLAAKALNPAGAGDMDAMLVVLAIFMATNLLNFVLVFADMALTDGLSWRRGFKEMYVPVLPAQCAMALLTAGVYLVARQAGSVSVLLMAVVILVFQWLLRTALAAHERGEQVAERNEQLAALQVGLISTMLKTLSLRDHMTARHSAAVARYSRAMAEALGLSEREQDLIHTAALFHDIGKFIFPDSILLTDKRLTDEEYEIVKRHPEVGAEVIAEIEGYGPVAEVVRNHHERIDGRGYPDGLAGDTIPLGSRIIAVADVYDVITARDTYRTPVTVGEAIAELRRSAGSQLDAFLVEVFIDLVERKGVAFRHSTAADFEAELSLERRVREYAAPKIAA